MKVHAPQIAATLAIVAMRARSGRLASPSRPSLRRRDIWAIAVFAPTVFAAIYYGLLASDRYVSEATYVVNRVDSQKVTGLDLLLQTFGVSHTDESRTVQAYLLSRDAVAKLESRLNLRGYFGSQKGDFFARFPFIWQNRSFESLYDYYLDHVIVLVQGSKGISSIRVVAFDPKEAKEICKALIELAESKVNELNVRAERDAIEISSRELVRAKDKLLQAQELLTVFRTRSLLLDPNTSSLAVMQTLTALSTELSQTQVQINGAAEATGSSPSLEPLRTKARSLEAQIATVRGQLGGEGEALAPKIAQFERLTLDMTLARQEVEFASKSLDSAREQAQRKKIYIERVAGPSLPDDSREPERLRKIFTVFVFSLALASVVWILRAGVTEHAIDD